MKKAKRLTAVILSALIMTSAFSALPVSAGSDDGIIYNDDTGIPDPVLYNYLISEYDINNDGVLQKEEADSIITIDYSLYDVVAETPVYSLKGLNKCKNLKIIYFNYNKLSNLNGIEGLNLVHIYVNSNELTDITAIIGMEESLETLSVKNNLLSSLPDMKNFNNLKLNLRYYETDFSYNKLLLKELNEKLPTQLSGYFNYWMQSQNPDLGELSLFDEDTGIEVDGTMDTDAALKVEKLENTFENSVATYDITLQKDGIAIQPDGAITIKIPSDVKDCKVMWLKDDGTAEDMNAKYTDGCYVFTTDHLSVYALVQDKTILTGDANQDGIVNVNDVTYLQMHIAGKKNTDGSSLIDETNKQLFDCVDMNKDGKLSVADVTALQIYISQNN
jgi:dockerin type I repeat protein